MQGKITKRTVEALREGEWLWDSAVTGFGAKRGKTGVFYYLCKRIGGTQRQMGIGRHGSPWTPDMARAEARRLLVQIHAGTDPLAQRNAPAPETFGAAMERYLTWKQGEVRPRSFEEVERHLRHHAKPLHRLPLGEVNRRTIAQLLGEVEARGKVARNRARTSISAMFRWAISEGLVEHNPVSGTGVAAEVSRDRVLTPAELSAIWAALPDSQFGDIVRLLILTGQRREEIGWLRWDEIVGVNGVATTHSVGVAAEGGSLLPFAAGGGPELRLSAERTKNRREHTVPLAPVAADILARQSRRSRRCVFGIAADGFSGWSEAKSALDARLKLAHWTLHDLRRTCATGLAELGVLPHIIETVLNHQSGHRRGVAGIYNRATYASEVRAALERWAEYVVGLGTDASPLRLVAGR
jgi:integrase